MAEEKRKREEEEEESEAPLESGLGAIFGGLDTIMGSVRELTDMASRTAADATKMAGREGRMSGQLGTTGLFGFSIGHLSTGEPKVEPFGNIRQTERGLVVDEVREPIIDLFEDAGHLLVVAELPGVAEQDISYKVEGDVLTISTSGDRKYTKEVSLPSSVDGTGIEATYNNGILQLKLEKERRMR
ncbi:MAG: Hsp20/alpha crystallin family protein [Dehalococcoidia bacterium]